MERKKYSPKMVNGHRRTLPVGNGGRAHAEISECPDCCAQVGWVKSKRTGRFYPADVAGAALKNARVDPTKPHKC